MNRRKNIIIIGIILLLALICYILRCCNKPQETNPTDASIPPKDTTDIRRIPNQVIVSFPKGTSEENKENARKAFVDSQKVHIPDFNITVIKKCECDTLELWEANKELIFGQDGIAGNRPPPVKGEGDKVPGANGYFSNYIISEDLPKTPVDLASQMTYSNDNSKSLLKIAVMDTGLDTSKIDSEGLVMLPESTDCPKGSWNFVDSSQPKNFHDDHTSQHGTWVTQLLLDRLGSNNVQILALKVLDKDKKGDLFSLLCAINHSIRNNVTAINMSLGYYGQENALLKKYMAALKEKNIWVFAAAGNADELADNEEKQINRGVNFRDLDARHNKFYPACFSKDFDNIITVTSIQNGGNVCSNQNFSAKYVNVGVMTDLQIVTDIQGRTRQENNCGFNYSDVYLNGSSFATPILAGKFLKTTTQSARESILSTIQTPQQNQTVEVGQSNAERQYSIVIQNQ